MKKIFASILLVGVLAAAGLSMHGCASDNSPDARIAIQPGTPDAPAPAPDAH
jgi:hypothetical protein